MDLLTGGLCLTLAVVSALVLYFISVSSMKEKTYDEVKAEQKKKAEEYLAQGRSAKEKAKDKKLKKAGKKVKEKSNVESNELSSDEVEHGKGHVAFVEPPIVLDEQPPTVEDKKKKKNKKKEKPILINKSEITPVIDVPEVPTKNHFEQIVPKDDFTLKHSISREDVQTKPIELQSVQKQSSSSKQTKTQVKEQPKELKIEKVQVQKQVQQLVKPTEKAVVSKMSDKPINKPQEKTVSQKPAEEVVMKTSVKQVQSASVEHVSPSAKNNRKKRSELSTLHQMSGDKEAVNVNLLMPLVHKAELSRTEIQVLIDLLLNKQQGSSVESAEWIEGRQDPVMKLKKQLAEKEKALVEEQDAAAALQNKLRELRQELNTEKQSTKQMEEALRSKATEVATMGMRLQTFGEEKQNLMKQMQQLQSKLSEEHMLLCKLQEDQSQTQGAMQQELLAQRQQLEMHIARLTEQHQETVAAMEGQLQQLAGQLQEQEAVNTQLSGELALARDSRQIKELHSEMERLKSKSQYDTSRLQNEVSSLTEQLNMKRSENDKLSSLVQTLQTENNRLAHQISSACVEAQRLRDDNESLAAQVTASMERPATEGRENGDHSFIETKHHNSEKSLENETLLENLKSDIVCKEKELSNLKTELAQNETAMNSLKADLSTAHANSEKMLKEISSYKSLVTEQESVISALREEGDSAHKLVITLREDVNKSKAEISRLDKDFVSREQLENREATIEKLTSELNTHKTMLADQQALVQSLKSEIDSFKASINKNDNQEELSAQLITFKKELTEKEATIKSLTNQVHKYEAEVRQLQDELVSSKELVSKYTQEIKDHINKITSLSQEIAAQKRKNDEAEENARLEEQEKTKQFLSRTLPRITIDTKQDYKVWLEQFVECARENGSTSSTENGGGENHAEMLAEVEQQNCQLQAMVTHYKSIIADTEGMLNRLQSHVEQEEGRWGQQIQTLESQLEIVKQERDRLEASARNGVPTKDSGCQTQLKRRNFAGWLRNKLRSRSRPRSRLRQRQSRRRSLSCTSGHQSS
ncbi:kinectin isoform X2 [Macrosteles quadrilineatus]|uniref:kinectin isoform X2 n=1 Tax=Macrosteles quadrilineatus TaxID=74068 RepID=UPI0023E1C3DF|nr:kinectin isoform X2 [Macrosteles quadrilineatus]